MTMSGHALVTGASSGIGRACALELLGRGLRVTGWDKRRPENGDALMASEAFSFDCVDVADGAEVSAAAVRSLERAGPWDGAVNCAGVLGPTGLLHELDARATREALATNLEGVLHCMTAELGQMVMAGGGAIVNVASAAGLVGFPRAGPYTASKFAVVGLTKNAAIDYAELGVRVNAVAPGGVDTPLIRATTCATAEGEAMIKGLHPMKRLAGAGEIAAAVAFLIGDEASFVTGAVLAADGGWCAQ